MATKTTSKNPRTGITYDRVSYDRWELHSRSRCRKCGGRNGHEGLFAYNGKKGLFCSKYHYHDVHGYGY